MDRRNFLRAIFSLSAAAPVAAGQALPAAATTSRAILLQTSPLAGFQYYDGEAIWSQLALEERLELRREAANQYDEFAIEVWWRGRKLGYLPRGENETIAAMMDRGETFFGRISRLRDGKNPWERLELQVWLAT
ncbi:MAG: HIRAN domain-containing protein [Anaerolineae bacterium]